MALLVPDGYIVAAFHHRITGWNKDLVCTIGLDASGDANVNQTKANAIFSAWANAMKTSVTPSLTFLSVILYWKQPLGYVPVPSNAAAVVGTSSGTSLPPNTAVLVEKNTSRPGRAGKGRMYLPGFNEAFVDPNGNLTAPGLTQVNTDLTAARLALINGIFSGINRTVLFHDDGVPSPAPTLIETLSADARVSSISKRFKR